MQIESLHLTHFRNYEELSLEPGMGLNVFVGRNAQGKSNLLEAAYVLATSKSTRAGKDTELIEFGSDAGAVRANIVREQSPNVEIELRISHSEKKAFRLNGVRHTKLAEVIGQLNTVLFDSGDLEIVRGDPSYRRRFLDLEISQTSPRYVHALGSYRKTLEQRNRLLRDLRDARIGADGRAVLPAYNEQLAVHGALLMERRLQFLTTLALLAAEVHQRLSDRRDELSLRYDPSFSLDGAFTADEIKVRFLEELENVGYDEIARGTTLRGPQRDDVLFSVNGQECRLFGSQGQQRTVALSLKLAERQLLTDLMGEPPILLLDDVLSDLDDVRRRHLFALTDTAGSQTFLSCTNLRAFSEPVLSGASVFGVSAGKVQKQ